MRVSLDMRHAHVAGCSHIAAQCQAARPGNPRPRRRPTGRFARPSRFRQMKEGPSYTRHLRPPPRFHPAPVSGAASLPPQIRGGPSGVQSATLARVGPEMPRRVRHTSRSRTRAARIRSVSLIQATSRRESSGTAEYHQPSALASTRVVLSHGGERPGKRYSTDTSASRSSLRRRAPWRVAKHAVRPEASITNRAPTLPGP
jgi:hypothetical protein